MKIKNKLLRKIHIYSSLICCTLLIFFSLTGISLNHRDLFEAEPKQTTSEHVLKVVDEQAVNLLLKRIDISLSAHQLSSLIVHKELSLPSPGKRVEFYIEEQSVFIDTIDFGLLSQLNELHQGRYTSITWKVVSDFTAIIFIFIALTGVWLSLRDNKQRRNYYYFLSLSLVTFLLFME